MKDIKDYEGLYAITSCGKVWSYRSKKFLQPYNNRGYLRLELYGKDGSRKKYSIHRLVAEAYIPSPEEKPQVNHLDENKQNNCVNNLEWATAEENTNHGTRNQRVSKPVYCVELDKVFKSQTAAANELGLYNNNISRCCNGFLKTTGGYHFRFAEVCK